MSYRSRAANRARSFNSLMHYVNEKWVSRVLGIPVNPSKGADLVDDKRLVEVKFKITYPGKYTHQCWRILEHQMDYPAGCGLPGFWALGNYEFKKVASLVTDTEELEALVIQRELWMVNWDWMQQFPSYRQRGNTELSKWDNTLRFAKKRLLPAVDSTYEVVGGKINFTEGVNPVDFGFHNP